MYSRSWKVLENQSSGVLKNPGLDKICQLHCLKIKQLFWAIFNWTDSPKNQKRCPIFRQKKIPDPDGIRTHDHRCLASTDMSTDTNCWLLICRKSISSLVVEGRTQRSSVTVHCVWSNHMLLPRVRIASEGVMMNAECAVINAKLVQFLSNNEQWAFIDDGFKIIALEI